MVYLFAQHLEPCGKEAIVPIHRKEYLKVFSLTLKIAVPAAYFWLSVFYMLFHSYLNLWAELTYFADRRFYSDWWNAPNLTVYWRKWNAPIHNFLHRHIYYPCRRKGISVVTSSVIVFFVSAVFHEYVMIGII